MQKSTTLTIQIREMFFFSVLFVVTANATELLAHYPLDGDYKDYAEGLYPLTPFGTPTFVAGKFGQAVLFDGPLTGTGNATEYLRNNTGLNPALANEKDFTILFWVKTTQAGYAGPEFQQPGIVSAEKGGYEDWSTFINADGRLGFYVQFLPVAWPTSTIPINDGKWHHIAVTRNNTTGNLQIYIDGVLNVERIEEGSKGNVGAGSNVYVGGQNPAEPHTQFNGEIDDVYFYNGVLTENEIKEHAGIIISDVYNVLDYGAVGDGITDDAPAIWHAIEAAIASGPGKTVLFPTGTYYLYQNGTGSNSGWHFDIHGATNLTIRGEVGTKLISGQKKRAFFHFVNCTGCSLKKIEMDRLPLRFTQGIITSVDFRTQSVVAKIDVGYPDPNDPLITEETDHLLNIFTLPDRYSYQEEGRPVIEAMVPMEDDLWNFELNRTPSINWVGKKWILRGVVEGAAFNIDECSDILVEDVSWYYGGGCAFTLYRNPGDVTVRRFYMGPPPGSDRLYVSGGCHQGVSNRGTFTLEDSDISFGRDDAINQTGVFDHIIEHPMANQIKIESGWLYEVGDTVSIWDWTYREYRERQQAQIVNIINNDDGTRTLVLNRDVIIVKVGPAVGEWWEQERDGIDRVTNLNSVGRMIIRNCRLTTGFARPILMKTQDSLIEDCYIYGSLNAGIQAGAEAYWNEGPQVRNLVIRNCTFEDIDSPCIDIGFFNSTKSRDFTNIVIEGNTFLTGGRITPWWDTPQGAGVRLRNVDGAIVRNNIFDGIWNTNLIVQYSRNVEINNNIFRNAHQQSPPVDARNDGNDKSAIVWIDDADNISFSNNIIENWGFYGSQLVKLTESATNIHGANAGMLLTDSFGSLVVGHCSGLALDSSREDGILTQQVFDSNAVSQQWHLIPTDSPGYFKIYSADRDLYVGVNRSVEPDAVLQLETDSSDDFQSWRSAAVGNDYISLFNKGSGLTAQVSGASVLPGAIIDQQVGSDLPHQRWQLLLPPTGLWASAGYKSVTLRWRISPGAESYYIKRALASGGPYTMIASGIPELYYIDTGLTNGQTYYYVISALTAVGQSAFSNEASSTPSLESTLTAWFKADALTGISNGDAVDNWADLSGKGHNAVQILSNRCPTYMAEAMNGHPVIRFNAVDSSYLAFPRPIQDDFTIILVYQSNQGLGKGTQFYQGAGLVSGEVPGVTDDFGTCLNADGRLIGGTGNPDTNVVSRPGFNDGQPHVMTFKRLKSSDNVSLLSLYVDGVHEDSVLGGAQSLTAPNRLVIGAQQVENNFLTGDIAEVRLYDIALFEADRNTIEIELINQYIRGMPAAAADPYPPDGDKRLPVNIVLKWKAGTAAMSHDIYLSRLNEPLVPLGSQQETTYVLGPLAYSTTYAWRIDEVNADGKTIGSVWTFTTAAAGDLDLNGQVDFEDFVFFALHWLEECMGNNNGCKGADIDFSGNVDLWDLAWLARNWMFWME